MTKPNGKTALVTGSTDGVGRLVAKRLAEGGWRVLVHGRDRGRGEAIVAEIAAAGGTADFLQADLSSIAEARRLADAVQKTTRRLELLINNAGLGSGLSRSARRTSLDGHELLFAVNYLAGFLLTYLLLPLIKKSAPARIVNVSSLGQQAIDFDDVMLADGYSGSRAYCQSKTRADPVHDRSCARNRRLGCDRQCAASGDLYEYDHGAPVRRDPAQQRRRRSRGDPQACRVTRTGGQKRALFQRPAPGACRRSGL